MNQDQILSLVRTFLKVIGTILTTHGATKAADFLNTEAVIGLVMAIIGVIMSWKFHKDDSKPTGGITPLLFLLGFIAFTVGCKTPNLEPGGAYAPVATNAVNQTEPETALYVADATYKLAYDTVVAVVKFERDNRAELQKISPNIKKELDKMRFLINDINFRWAIARHAYKANPTPEGLTTVKRIIAEMQRLVPVVQSQLEPVYQSATSTQ